MTSFRRDLHPQDSAHAGRTKTHPTGKTRRVRSQLLVSRVLLLAEVALDVLAVIPLGRSLPSASCGLPRDSGGQPSNAPLHGLAPDGVCRAATVTDCAVGSYPTVSPLPEAPKRPGRSTFLWHFPRGFPHRALPGILPCGARTFLAAQVCSARSPEMLWRAELSLVFARVCQENVPFVPAARFTLALDRESSAFRLKSGWLTAPQKRTGL
jgi:hypothetical protein